MKKHTVPKLISAGLIVALILTGCTENSKEDAQASADTQTVQLTEADASATTADFNQGRDTDTAEKKVEEAVQAEEDKEETDTPDEAVSEDEDVNEDGVIGGAEKYEGEKTEDDNESAVIEVADETSGVNTEASNSQTATGSADTPNTNNSSSNSQTATGSNDTSNTNSNSTNSQTATGSTGTSTTNNSSSNSQTATGSNDTSDTNSNSSNSQNIDSDDNVVINPPAETSTPTTDTTQTPTVEETYTYETVLCTEMLTLVNERRTNVCSTSTLVWASDQEDDALRRARELADNFVHSNNFEGAVECIHCAGWREDTAETHDAYVESYNHDQEMHWNNSYTKMVSATCYRTDSDGHVATFNVVILDDDWQGVCIPGDGTVDPIPDDMVIIW